ncbi:MAG TPA: hypothetical protein VM187_05170 [Niastella sp.]|nr:hypothetical protein [Niastella sp.]
MKTSNKILLGIFLAIILLSASINLMVYAKYKRGDYVPFQREVEKMTTVNLPAARYVSITALCSVEILNSPAASFEVKQGEEKSITYHMVGDTMVIQGNTSFTKEQMERGECNYQLLKLHLPATTAVFANYATARVNGSADSAQAPSFNINLGKNSTLILGNNEKEKKYFNQLLLSGDHSYLEMNEHLVVYDLSLKLINDSKFDSRKAELKSLKLDVDNKSVLILTGTSIKNLQ